MFCYSKIVRNTRYGSLPAQLLLDSSSLHPAPSRLGSDPVVIDINTLLWCQLIHPRMAHSRQILHSQERAVQR